jgi:hypothetical protein
MDTHPRAVQVSMKVPLESASNKHPHQQRSNPPPLPITTSQHAPKQVFVAVGEKLSQWDPVGVALPRKVVQGGQYLHHL